MPMPISICCPPSSFVRCPGEIGKEGGMGGEDRKEREEGWGNVGVSRKKRASQCTYDVGMP